MIVGLTGGIGSGKSTIAKQLRNMGHIVYDTDSHAKRIIVEDLSVREKIVQLFGEEVFANGVYQTTVVAQKVFADKSLLEALNAIVHPAVRKDIARQNKQLSESEIMFVECAILYSSGISALCDKVVLVTAPEEVRLQRTIQRDHSTIDKVRARMRAQDLEMQMQRADIVVINDGQQSVMDICDQILCNL
jgi:dephospho-CoA kinase